MAAKARGSGGGGRDVIFRLRVMADPNDLKTIKQFADEVAKAQKKFDETAAGTAAKGRKLRDEEGRARKKLEDEIAKHHVKTALKAADERQKIERRAAAERERDARREAAENIRLAQQRDAVIAKNHLREAKREAAENVRLAQQRDAIIAKNHLREHLRAIDEEKRARIRANRDMEREAIASARREARGRVTAQREAMSMNLRRAQGFRNIANGSIDLGRGLAYSGLVGEQSSEAILNTLFAVEGASSVARGGINIMKGLRGIGRGSSGRAGASAAARTSGIVTSAAGSAWAIPATMGGGGGAAAGGAGLAGTAGAITAAVAAVAAALYMGASTIRDAAKHGFMGGATPGSGLAWVGEKQAGMAQSLMGFLPKRAREFIGHAGHYTPAGAAANANLEADRAAAAEGRAAQTSAWAERRRETAAGAADIYGGIAGLRRGMIDGNMGRARSALGSAMADYRGARGGDDMSADRRAYIGQHVLELESDIVRIQKEAHAKALAAGQDRLSLVKSELVSTRDVANERKRMADEAKADYASDILKFATLDPTKRAAVKRIDAKRDRGETLTESELELASGFNEFRGAVASSAEKRARAAGAGEIFTSGRAEAGRLAKEASDAAAAVAKAELSVKQQIEVVHKLEADTSFEKVLDEGFQKIKKEILDDQDKRLKELERSFESRSMTLRNRDRPRF